MVEAVRNQFTLRAKAPETLFHFIGVFGGWWSRVGELYFVKVVSNSSGMSGFAFDLYFTETIIWIHPLLAPSKKDGMRIVNIFFKLSYAILYYTDNRRVI